MYDLCDMFFKKPSMWMVKAVHFLKQKKYFQSILFRLKWQETSINIPYMNLASSRGTILRKFRLKFRKIPNIQNKIWSCFCLCPFHFISKIFKKIKFKIISHNFQFLKNYYEDLPQHFFGKQKSSLKKHRMYPE